MAEVELKVEQMGDFKDGGTKMKLTTRAVYYIMRFRQDLDIQ